MFNLFGMFGNYEQRKIARTEFALGLVSTAEVTDSRLPYETAVSHPSYNEGKLIIVEAYTTRDDAQSGHDRWVAVMTAEELPDTLTDCCNFDKMSSFYGKNPPVYKRQD